METILDAIRVIEMTEALAGPYCAMLLGDFGADVIKVERPGVGDQSRGWGPPFVGSESRILSRGQSQQAIDYYRGAYPYPGHFIRISKQRTYKICNS